jgi:hypothetical protein
VITESTPVKPTDPLPDSKRTLFFLSQRTREQQLESIHSNPYYLTSLNDWLETLDTDDLTENQQKLIPYLPLLRDLLQEGFTYYQSLAQQVSQLRATNNQLKEDNNRLSTLPHKDPSFSRLQEDHAKLVKTFNELNNAYREVQEGLQNAQKLLPGVTNPAELASAIKGKIQTESHADQLVGELQTSLLEWENVGLSLLATKDGRPPTALEAQQQADNVVRAFQVTKEQLDKLRRHHRRLSDSITSSRSSAKMPEESSSSTTHATGMIQGDNLSPGNIRTFWEQVPALYRNLPSDQEAPTTAVELMDALRNLSCAHPRQAAIVLGDSTGTQEWDESLGQMDQLYHHTCPEPETETIPTTSPSRLFRPTDVPAFKDDKDYDGFRGSLVSFLQSEDPPRRNEFGRALLRILGSIEAPSARVAAKNWNVERIIRPTWKATYEAFLAALDEKFESQTILQDSKVAWLGCWPKNDEKPAEFFNRFEGLTEHLKDVQRRKGAPELSDSIITERLLIVLPRYLTNQARIHFAEQGKLMELETPKALRKHFEVTWTYTPRPAAIGHDTKSRFKTANAIPAPAQSANNVKERQCGIIASYDTSPPVPREARGSLMPHSDPVISAENAARRHFCAQRKLCLYCRRSQSEHQASAPRFKAVTVQNARPAPARIEVSTPVPGQLQIEAAPTTSQ